MVISPWHVYLITILDRVNGALLCLLTLLFALGVFLWACSEERPSYFEGERQREEARRKRCEKLFPRIFCAAFLCLFGFIATPTTKEMCAIIVIPKIANNQELQGLGSDIIELSREWINSLKPQQEEVK